MKRVLPAKISGEISAPPSKSVLQRVVAAAALGSGRCVINNPSLSADGRAALRAAQAFGSNIEILDNQVVIEFGGKPRGGVIDCAESALTFRLFSAIAALYDVEFCLVAGGSLRDRPMQMVTATLKSLGVQVSTDTNGAPRSIRGPLRGGIIAVDGSISSQFVSGLLMALPLCAADSTLTVNNLRSADYVRLTIAVLNDFGVQIREQNDKECYFIPGRQRYQPRTYAIEGDWSGAAFLLVAGAIAGEVTVRNLRNDSFQADRHILEALRQAGALVEEGSQVCTVSTQPLKAFEFDATDCPDLFPPLAALACHCQGISRIRGAGRLAYKESNRAVTLRDEFRLLGVDIQLEEDVMSVRGGPVSAGRISSRGDHRIAMAGAVAALRAQGPVDIIQPEAVAKSYEHFFEDLETLREAV